MQKVVYGRLIDFGDNPSTLCKRRWSGELSPEPETVEWIETLMMGKTFFDVGASVGRFAIMASLRGLSVTAFEPFEPVFNEMFETVRRNNLPILCSQFALSDANEDGWLARGRSTATFAVTSASAKWHPASSMTLDAWCKDRKPPAHIKIDVDGNEEQIIRGGEKTWTHVKSALIEVDPVTGPNIPYMMSELGFYYNKGQVRKCAVREGKYKGMANYIFYR